MDHLDGRVLIEPAPFNPYDAMDAYISSEDLSQVKGQYRA